MSFRSVILVLLTSWWCVATVSPGVAGSDLEELGDVLQQALPIGALASTFVAGGPTGGWWDIEGTQQAVLSLGATSLSAHTAKQVVDKRRPDSRNTHSFPSGHTASAFAGAAFIATRYGWTFGLPAVGLAALTGYSRARSNEHYADDVLAGASIALMYNWIFVTPRGSAVRVTPTVGEHGLGMALSVRGLDGGAERSPASAAQPSGSGRFRYEFRFGPHQLTKSGVSAGDQDGATWDVRPNRDPEEPRMSATALLSVDVNDHNLRLGYLPLGYSGVRTMTETVTFQDVTLPRNRIVSVSWRLHDVELRWRRPLARLGPGTLRLGAGLRYQETHLTLHLTATRRRSARLRALIPTLNAALALRVPFGRLALDAEGTVAGPHQLWDLTASAGVAMGPAWELVASYRVHERSVVTRDLRSDIRLRGPSLGFARRF